MKGSQTVGNPVWCCSLVMSVVDYRHLDMILAAIYIAVLTFFILTERLALLPNATHSRNILD